MASTQFIFLEKKYAIYFPKKKVRNLLVGVMLIILIINIKMSLKTKIIYIFY
jgi:hypothetical protein